MERFTRDHEYVRIDGDVAVVGITRHAAEQLGDVVFVEVPEAGRQLKAGEAAGVVESVKAASDVFSPVGGEVVEANSALASNPQWVNEEPEGKAWFFKVRIADKSELDKLIDRAAYEAFLKESG
ncbi:MAG TPA: glycine cleavage system protein GcvH [Hyphomicrobiaceae bacterium]|nr:glycine cleavage system protein GcvH [Hyphomicrobiaceae bacterium]